MSFGSLQIYHGTSLRVKTLKARTNATNPATIGVWFTEDRSKALANAHMNKSGAPRLFTATTPETLRLIAVKSHLEFRLPFIQNRASVLSYRSFFMGQGFDGFVVDRSTSLSTDKARDFILFNPQILSDLKFEDLEVIPPPFSRTRKPYSRQGTNLQTGENAVSPFL